MLIHVDGEWADLPLDSAREIEQACALHLGLFPDAATKPIWFDLEERICFSAAQLRGGLSGKDYSFLAEPDDFLASMWGERFVVGSVHMNPALRVQSRRMESEMICSAIEPFSQVAGKRLLIILGGPSTRSVNWEVFERDCCWSCNKFYLNSRVARQHLDVVALAPDVPLLDNRELHAYVDRHKSLLAFEVDRGGPVGSWSEINELCRLGPTGCGIFHLRYQSALGLGSRLLLLSLLLGAREVGVVGLDGMSEHGPLHAFERYKSNPNWVQRFGLGLQRRQYVLLWEYVLQLRERLGFTLYNLGAPSMRNLSRQISERWSPLPERLYRQLEA